MELRRCKNCVMDNTASEIVFDENGVCNFCQTAQQSLRDIEKEKSNLYHVLDRIKKDGKGKKYDVLCGLSGGVDSSTALHFAVLHGLRPLCYTVDNGWNTSLADENILKMVEKLNIPFYRKTIDLKKFRELQAAFLHAGVKNIEIPSDHMILATSLELAKKYKIKWILSGGNVVSESVMPASWGYQSRDLTHIKAIYKNLTGQKLKGLPMCSIWDWNVYKWIHGIKTFYLLDYINYDVKTAKKMLAEEYGWQDYGDKHEESIYTKWFQSFYIYHKWGIDKRKAHYSSLINSGQMTREDALQKISVVPTYDKMGNEERVLRYKKHEYNEFPIDKWYDRISKIIRLCKSMVNIKRV